MLFRSYDKTSRFVIESCSVVFEENDGSQVAQPHVSSVDVEIPKDAIKRMGVGFFRPIEGHLWADQEELCSTLVDHSYTQEKQANGATNAPTQEQVEDPPTRDEVTTQEPSSPIINASQDQSQDQSSSSHVEAPQVEALKLIKANLPVKMGTQMIKMIKRFLLAIMRISNPVVKQEV